MYISFVERDWCELAIPLLRFSDPICHSDNCIQIACLTKESSLPPRVLAVCRCLNEAFLLTPMVSLGCLCQFLVLSLFILMYTCQTARNFYSVSPSPKAPSVWINLGLFSSEITSAHPLDGSALKRSKEQKAEWFKTQSFQVVHFAAEHHKLYLMVLIKTRRSSERALLSVQPMKPPDLRFSIAFPRI